MSFRILYNCYYESESYLKDKYKELNNNKYLAIDEITGERVESNELESFDFYLNARLEDYQKEYNIELKKTYSDSVIVYKIKKFEIKRR